MRDPLIQTGELAALLAGGDVRIVDATWFLDGRSGRESFERAHIPTAVFFDIDVVSDQASHLPHMLPSPAAFEAAAGGLGVSERDRIVVYDAQGLFSAARVWWTFRVMGADDVRVLDGGLPRWLAEGRPVEAGPARPAPARFQARFRPELVRDRAQVARELASGGQVADARPASRFRGEAPEPRAGLRSGHMPGARSLPMSSLLAPDGLMRPAEDIRELLHEAGLDPARPVTASCGSGITAAVIALALARLGRDDAAVYDGSWAEWGSHPDTEIATGPA